MYTLFIIAVGLVRLWFYHKKIDAPKREESVKSPLRRFSAVKTARLPHSRLCYWTE